MSFDEASKLLDRYIGAIRAKKNPDSRQPNPNTEREEDKPNSHPDPSEIDLVRDVERLKLEVAELKKGRPKPL